MSPTNDPTPQGDRPVTQNPSRRRLFKGVAGGTGVLLSVHAKTALGTTVCKSPSQIFSGNTSPRPDNGTSCSGGRSPGYWVQPQHFGAWTQAGAVPPTFNPALQECSSGLGDVALSAISTSGTTFMSVFGNDLTPKSGVTVPRPVPLWAIIYSPNSFQGNMTQVARHLACAWLNAKLFQGSSALYPLTPDQVKDMWLQLTTMGSYCPKNTTCSVPWSAEQVKSYIEGMYDFNAPVPNYCKSA